ncbi:MAG: ATP synthase F1 subunit delta [Desulfovibrionales bacterium]
MMGNIVARRYARALFAIGQKEGADELQKYGQELSTLAELLHGAPELLRIFKNPIFGTDKKRAVLEKVVERLDLSTIVKNFCFLLAEKDRVAFLPEIQSYYSTLLDEAQGISRGRMVTAFELADARRKEISRKLEEQADRKVILDFEVDEGILGGLVLKMGDMVFDASLRAQLESIKENIKRGE